MSLASVPREHRDIPIALIDEPRLRARTKMDEDALEKLAQAMIRNGFIGSIMVATKGDRYEVIAGHRRRLAAARAGLVTIPCQVFPDRGTALEAIKHDENKLREELSPSDEAIYFAELLEENPDEGTDGIAAIVGERREYVEASLSLILGDERVFEDLKEGRIGRTIALELNRCTDALHRNMLRHNAVHQGANVSTVKQWIRDWRRNVAPYVSDAAPADAGTTGVAHGANDYFRCVACGETENPIDMRALQLHTYCQRAIVDPAIRMWQSRSDYVPMPRTREEAIALVDRILARFPEIGQEHPS